MIDLGISKLMIIGVVALVVIGPEKLPRVARTVGTLLGRAQRYVNDVKSEVSQQMDLEELNKMKKSVEDAAREMQQSVDKTKQEVHKTQKDIEAQIQEANPKLAASNASSSASTSTASATTETGQIGAETEASSATNAATNAIKPANATPGSSATSKTTGSLANLPPPTKPVSELQRLGQETLRDMVRKVNGMPPAEKRDFQQKCRAQRMATPMWYKRRARTKSALLSSAARHTKS